MVEIIWQYIAVIVLLALSVGYLIYRFFTRRKKPKCDACPLYKSVGRTTSVNNTGNIDNSGSQENHKTTKI